MANGVASSLVLQAVNCLQTPEFHLFCLFLFIGNLFIAKTQSDRKFKLIGTSYMRSLPLFTLNCFLIDTNNYVNAALYQISLQRLESVYIEANQLLSNWNSVYTVPHYSINWF